MVEMPAVGPIREKQDAMMEGFPTFVNLCATWMESNIDFQNVLMEATRRMQEKTSTEMKGELTAENYKDYYDIWIETYSDTFKDFMKSEHYASDMGRLTSYFMDFQKYNQKMMEDNYLKQMNLPTKTELDEINKEIYHLKKIVREQSAKIKELYKKI